MTQISHIVLDHKRDAAWIIKLWLDIHGGDPVPTQFQTVHAVQDKVTAQAIAALAETLPDKAIAARVKEAVAHAL